MENTILQLIKIITALYLNSMAGDNNPQIFEEIQLLLKEVKIDRRAGSGLGSEDAVIEALRYTAEWMVCNRTDNEYNKSDILQRLSINLQDNTTYIDIVKEAILDEVTPDQARVRINGIMQELRYEKKRNKVKTIISKANAELNFSGEYTEIMPYLNKLMMELGDIHIGTKNETPGLVGKIDFTNDDEIESALNKGVNLINDEGVLNTGFQGLNNACGGKGVPRGFMVNFAGLTHHYKSGILIDLSLNIPVFNDPWMWDNTKKPMILRISFENTIDQDIMIMYKKLYEVTYRERCDISSINLEHARSFLKEYFQQRGYTFHMVHYDPADFTITDLFSVINSFIDAGYELHSIMCDYLGQIAHNTFGDRLDTKIAKTIEMGRNFCYPKGITFFNGHQLSTEAQNESKINSAGFTRKVCTGGWYMDCRSLHTKLDLEFVMHIHQHVDGNSYLMFSRGKHRGGELTPMKYRHFMYKFEDIGGIAPDFGLENKALYHLPKVLDASVNEAIFDD